LRLRKAIERGAGSVYLVLAVAPNAADPFLLEHLQRILHCTPIGNVLSGATESYANAPATNVGPVN
jgi:hypothetical protein